jgi:hypothetical protein
MASEAVNKYIRERYKRWLDYAAYHCSLVGMDDEACDVLNEVLCMLLNKDESYLDSLLSSRKGGYTELDFYILQMIKLNITSDTSPYRHKYKTLPIDENIDWRRLEMPDTPEDQTDPNEIKLQKFNQVREILDNLYISEHAREVFSFRFFMDESFSDWDGPEDRRSLYTIYNGVLELIREKIYGNMLF